MTYSDIVATCAEEQAAGLIHNKIAYDTVVNDLKLIVHCPSEDMPTGCESDSMCIHWYYSGVAYPDVVVDLLHKLQISSQASYMLADTSDTSKCASNGYVIKTQNIMLMNDPWTNDQQTISEALDLYSPKYDTFREMVEHVGLGAYPVTVDDPMLVLAPPDDAITPEIFQMFYNDLAQVGAITCYNGENSPC
jgi:hypothetical protein